MMRDIVEATAEAWTIGLNKNWIKPTGVLLDQAKERHLHALVEMAQSGEICPRRVLDGSRFPDFTLDDADKCLVSFSDAQKFCRSLDIDLQAQPDEAAPVQPAAATPHQGNTTKTRLRDEADVFIDAALDAVKPATDVATVWSTLQVMARSKDKPGTLSGVADGKLQYSKGGEYAALSRDALGKRLKTRRNTP
jgi:hypothetical protein